VRSTSAEDLLCQSRSNSAVPQGERCADRRGGVLRLVLVERAVATQALARRGKLPRVCALLGDGTQTFRLGRSLGRRCRGVVPPLRFGAAVRPPLAQCRKSKEPPGIRRASWSRAAGTELARVSTPASSRNGDASSSPFELFWGWRPQRPQEEYSRTRAGPAARILSPSPNATDGAMRHEARGGGYWFDRGASALLQRALLHRAGGLVPT
jgi:hypothetical protein